MSSRINTALQQTYIIVGTQSAPQVTQLQGRQDRPLFDGQSLFNILEKMAQLNPLTGVELFHSQKSSFSHFPLEATLFQFLPAFDQNYLKQRVQSVLKFQVVQNRMQPKDELVLREILPAFDQNNLKPRVQFVLKFQMVQNRMNLEDGVSSTRDFLPLFYRTISS